MEVSMKKLLVTFFLIALASAQVFGFSSPPPPPAPTAVDPMFENIIAIGDSLTHGAQSMCIDETRQVKSYIAILAEQANTDFIQPLLRFPGFFLNIEDLGKGNIKWYQYIIPLLGGQRVDNYGNQSNLNNFAVSGVTVGDVLYTRGGTGLYDLPKLVLGKNGSPQLDQALDQNPTFMAAWIGGNDVLSCALWTDPDKITSILDFIRDYTEMARRITGTSSVEGVVTATIPDCSSIAYLQPANDPDVPAGSKKAFWNTSVGDNDEVLDPEELNLLTESTIALNEEIERIAAANDWALVDTFAIIVDIANNGYYLRDNNGNATNRLVNADFLGGLFSLDGFHPSVTGHAIMANYFIEAINDTYGTDLDRVDEYGASNNDSLFTGPYDPRGVIHSWFGQTVQFFIEMFI